MSRLVVALAAIVLVAGCGGADPLPPGAPTEPPPKVEGPAPDPPPPAWVETESGTRWLAYGSYCWDDGCVDYVDPWSRDDIPEITVHRAEVVRFHLPFRPRELVLEVLQRRGREPRSVRLKPKPVFEWKIERAGYVSVAAWPRNGGDASYLARFTFR